VLHGMGGRRLPLHRTEPIAIDLSDLAATFPDRPLADLFAAVSVSGEADQAVAIVSAQFLADPDGDGRYELATAPRTPGSIAPDATGYASLPVFGDLTWDLWAYGDIRACASAGLVNGYADGSYQPGRPVTRDQMAVYTARALAGGGTQVPSGPSQASFSDVPAGYWAYDAIEYAAARGVVQGYLDGSYAPTRTVDRGAMAVFVARALAGGESRVPQPASATPAFTDVAQDYWSWKHISYLKQTAVVAGYADGSYHPDEAVTRDMMAAYLARAFLEGS